MINISKIIAGLLAGLCLTMAALLPACSGENDAIVAHSSPATAAHHPAGSAAVIETVFVDLHSGLDVARSPGCRACHKAPREGESEFWWSGDVPNIGPHNGIDTENPWVCCFCHNPKDWYETEE